VPTGTTYKIRNLPYRRAFGDFHFMIASLPDRNNNDLSSACGSENIDPDLANLSQCENRRNHQ
jgi:hypothetical protein